MALRQVQLAAARCVLAVDAGHNLDTAVAAERALQQDWRESERSAFLDLAYGCQRFAGSLSFYLRTLVHKPLSDPLTEAVLRVALYQLTYTQNAPHAVVHEAVSAIGHLAKGKFKSLGNAVLRRYRREQQSLQEACLKIPEARDNFPAWWLRRLRADYAENAGKIIALAARRPPLTLRVNVRQTTPADYLHVLADAGLKAFRLPESSYIVLEKPVPVHKLPLFGEGAASVQDFGASAAAALLAVRSGEKVLDACAAPGGKTAHILETADCVLTALDVDAARLARVEENLRRLRLQAALKVADAADLAQWWDGVPFDAVLADVPCTASGVVRRHPDIKWLRREGDAAKTAAQQVPLLDALWQTVRPGGRMLLATCSLFAEENEQQAGAFVRRHNDARLRAEHKIIPDEYQDGFYYALFDKLPESA